MSKSLGNFFTVHDLLDKGVPGEVIRFVFLSTHYSKPMDWTVKKADEAKKTLRKWRRAARGATASTVSGVVMAALSDDLNTAGALAELHKLEAAGDGSTLLASANALGLLTVELGSWFEGEQTIIRSAAGETVQKWADLIDEARIQKDYAAADTIRATAKAYGFEVKTDADGTRLIATPTADPHGLEEALK